MARRAGRSPRGIHFETHENPGKPWTVLIMGYAGGLASWGERFLARLAPHVSYVVMDNRGTGQSIKPSDAAEYAIETMADDTAEVVRLVTSAPVHLIGYSMGGCIAQDIAFRGLIPLERLSLIASIAGGRHYRSPGAATLKALAEPQGTALLDFFVATWNVCLGEDGTKKHWDALMEIFAEQSKHLTPRVAMRGHMKAYGSFDGSARLKNLTLPTTIIHGAKDPLTPLANSEALASLMPHAHFHVLPGIRHNPHVECPAELCQLLGIT